MIYLTQLIYLNEGQEEVFNEFEAMAIPLIAKYDGALLLRVKPGQVIEASIEVPFELHFISFPTETEFTAFMKDETRKSFLQLKEQSVRTSILVSGKKL
jgi:uncharacterized protein (DUF1330 family)